jgi:PhnB protein
MKNVRKKSVPPVREGFRSVTPYLVVDSAERLIEFAKKAFDAKVPFISKNDDGQVIHAYLQIGDSIIMVSDTMGMKAETALLYLYVDDADATYKKAVAAGGTSLAEPSDKFYGDRAGGVRDEWGNSWWIGTQIEALSNEELDRRSRESINVKTEA